MKKIFLILLSSLTLFGCKKNFLDTTPYSSVASETMWTSDNLTEQGVNAIYQALRLGQPTGGSWGSWFYDMIFFEALGSTGMYPYSNGMLDGTINPGDGLFSGNWQNLYTGIIRANDAIANIPAKSPSEENKKARLVAEAKFLRAFFYLRLNQLYKGVPIYLEPTAFDKFTKQRSTEAEVWEVVIKDLTDCINETGLPNKYPKGNINFGRVTKGAAYALRGKAYMYTKEWAKAAADFEAVDGMGYNIPGNITYTQLFKEANEQSEEMIFSIQHIAVPNLGNSYSWLLGSRSAANGGGWNIFTPSPILVDLYENADGSKFNWDEVIPGYSSMNLAARQVYFLRDNLSAAEIAAAVARGADMSKYLPNGNEARISAAYANRDPRLAANIITPYSTFNGGVGGVKKILTARFPYRNELDPANDLKSDAPTKNLYLYRKFVAEGVIGEEILNRGYASTDFPLIRFADVLLMWAEALNEQGDVSGAIAKVNRVRNRPGVMMPPLQQGDASLGTFVSNQEDMRIRIRNERKAEFVAEGITYFDELRWNTWKTDKFRPGNGFQYVWGQNEFSYTYGGEYLNAWAIPTTEVQMVGLTQNPGWPY
jgi:starch-binding outer membrane protein, SusD/RagB family